MSTFPAAVVVLVVFAAAGALPSVALAGRRWVAVPLAPLAGAVIAALSATAVLVVGGPIIFWFVALAAAAAALVVLRRQAGPGGQDYVAKSAPARRAGAAGAVVLVVLGAWTLLPLRAPTVGFDARTTWLLHAVWFADGHSTALAALRNPALSFDHTAYPPLIGGSVAVAWKLTGNHSYDLGVVVVALLNVAAVLAAATVLVEVGRRCGDAVAARRARFVRPGEPLPDRLSRLEAAHITGVVAAGLLVLVVSGVAGQFLTNGYADVLWASAAVGAVGFGLILPGTGHDLGACILLLAVAGLTKNVGIVTAMAVVVLLTARAVVRARARPGSDRRATSPWRAVVAGAVGIVALGVWPALTRLLGAAPDVAVAGRRVGDDARRLHLTADAMAGHLHVLLVAVPVALVGGVVLRRARRAAGIGNDGWAWAALVAGAVAVAVAYVAGSGTVAFWLDTSVHRTTFFPALMAWWLMAVWAVVASAQGDELPGDLAVDDALQPVLHHRV